jgi:hypothetical protein
MLGEALLSIDARNTAGILLIAILAVEFGGTYMLRIVRGRWRPGRSRDRRYPNHWIERLRESLCAATMPAL